MREVVKFERISGLAEPAVASEKDTDNGWFGSRSGEEKNRACLRFKMYSDRKWYWRGGCLPESDMPVVSPSVPAASSKLWIASKAWLVALGGTMVAPPQMPFGIGIAFRVNLVTTPKLLLPRFDQQLFLIRSEHEACCLQCQPEISILQTICNYHGFIDKHNFVL